MFFSHFLPPFLTLSRSHISTPPPPTTTSVSLLCHSCAGRTSVCPETHQSRCRCLSSPTRGVSLFVFFFLLPVWVCRPVATFQFPAWTGQWAGRGVGGLRACFLHRVYRQTQYLHLKKRTRFICKHERIFVSKDRELASHHQELKELLRLQFVVKWAVFPYVWAFIISTSIKPACPCCLECVFNPALFPFYHLKTISDTMEECMN